MSSPVIYWFRNDLRLHDNPSLQKAIDTGRPVIPVYVIDDVWFRQHPLGFERTGKYRQQFLFETLTDLNHSLEKAGNRLWVFTGNTVKILSGLYHSFKAERVFAQGEYAAEEVKIENGLAALVNLQLDHGGFLFPRPILPFSPEKSPFYYTAFKNKVWDFGEMLTIIPPITHVPGGLQLQPDQQVSLFDIPDSEKELQFKGGELEGLKRLEAYFSSGAVFKYTVTRNELHGKDFSSWLAPWLANGALSVRLVWQKLNLLKPADAVAEASVTTLKEQLIWRDYFRYLMMRYGKKLFFLKGLRSSDTGMYNDMEAFEKWRMGKTGQPLVDALMQELFHTGFMSNRGRMLVSYYLVKEMKVNWLWGAAWFESTLMDYDVYSNYGNWAYQSGRGTDSRVNRRFNLIKQAEKFDADGSFRKKWGN